MPPKARPKGRNRPNSRERRPQQPQGHSLERSAASINRTLQIPDDGVGELFRQWDARGDGTIDMGELKTVLVDIGVPEDDVPKLFSLADCNKDGKIDYEEFLAWVYTIAPDAVRGTSPSPPARPAQTPPAAHAALAGGHPHMRPMPPPADEGTGITVTCRLAAPRTPMLDFTIRVAPSTPIGELAERICQNHGGSIQEPRICVHRFHPEEVVRYSDTLEGLGIGSGQCTVYYDYLAQGGAHLA